MSFPLIAATLLAAAAPAPAAESIPVDRLSYADIADLSLEAPVAAHVVLREAVRLKNADAAGVAPGATRFYVEADVLSVIRGAGGLPAHVRYLVDLPNGADGRPPKLRGKSEFLLIGAPVPGRPGELRLAAPDAQFSYTAARAEILRAILIEAAKADAPPRITGIGRAFHVPGSLPGESETQIFLQTANGRPVSLSVLRRPGETPRWSVALSEIVDDAARPPVPGTLLWYRLACTLPPALPAQSFAEAEPGQRRSIEDDYRLIKNGLGPCVRSRAAR